MKNHQPATASKARPPTRGNGAAWCWRMVLPAVILLGFWGVVIWLINPVGEFTTNDDWSFVQSYCALFEEGRLIPTGWGQGGPALITHLLWGGLFAHIFGSSITVLRVSVLCLGVAASLGMMALLRALGAGRWLALLGGLLLACNPFLLSLSFTYLTDVTFSALLVMAVLALQRAERGSPALWLGAGLVLCLAATLTRQIGIVLPLALIAAALLRPGPRGLPRVAVMALAVLIVLLPWLGWEWFLSWAGSTPVTQHNVFTSITGNWVEKGPADYFNYALVRLFWVILPYCAFMVLPLLIVQGWAYLNKRPVRIGLAVYAGLFICFEAALLIGLIHPPVFFYRNTIINFGLGPLLFKDTYLMGLPALSPIHPALFYALVFMAAPGAFILLARSWSLLRRLFSTPPVDGPSWLALVCWLASAGYAVIILLTGFHDRYLLPMVVLLMAWLAADPVPSGVGGHKPQAVAWAPALIVLVVMGWFSVTATHDMVATRRAAHQAHDYLLHELKVDPCHVDGGFEFNGYHCRWRVKKPAPGLSWWWVAREDYLVALSALDGYRVVKAYPIKRWLGKDGAVYLLRPIKPTGSAGPG